MGLAHPSFLSPLRIAVAWMALAGPAGGTTLAAWVELIGSDAGSSARVIINEGECPDLTVDGKSLRMKVRADPGPLFPRGRKKMPPADFQVRVCEVILPAGTTSALLEGKPLPLPPAEIRRIVVFGDTGCRVKKKKTQDCNDRDTWPYAKLTEHAAEARPDLVIHVGDYLYREKACSKHDPDCPDVPTGYGWKVWDDDFFTPSAPLFAAAPWIMVRGNHETCGRAGEGWFRFLDAARPGKRCPETSDFFVVSYGNIGFVVMDSAAVPDASGGDPEDDDDNDAETGGTTAKGLATTLRRKFDKIVGSIPPNTWLLTHAPFNGVRVDKKTGDTEVDNTVQQHALGSVLPAGIKMIVSGHIHMFEAINFANGRPPQFVAGTGSTKLAKRLKSCPKLTGSQ